MARLVPLGIGLIDPGWVDRVPSPAHDALTPAQRREHLRHHPDSYLGVTRSVADLAESERGAGPDFVALCRAALERLVAAGAFRPPAGRRLFLYRLTVADHDQVGVVGGVAVDDYVQGRIRVHEQVDSNRTDDLAAHLTTLGVQSSPIALARRPDPGLDHVVAGLMDEQAPTLDFVAADGLRQRVWPIDDPSTQRWFDARLADRPLYVIDGHHRAAAAAALRESAGAAGAAGAGWMLAVLFATDQLRNRAFHRCLPSIDPAAMLDTVATRFEVAEATVEQVRHRADNELAVLAGGRWYTLEVPAVAGPDAEPASFAGIDPIRLQRTILQPLLGIDPERAGEHLTYLPAVEGTDDPDGLDDRRCGPVWMMRPVPIDTLLDAADVGQTMPPKSTYFEPKVRSGVFLRPVLPTAPPSINP